MATERTSARHLLIFEPDPRGHAAEWIEHLARQVACRGLPEKLSLAVPVALADEVISGGPEPWRDSLRVLPLRRWETALCNSRVLAISGLARWWVMRRSLAHADADHGLFLSLDHLTLPLALGLRFGGRQVSGILFRPSVHYATARGAPRRFAERIRELRKAILYPATLANPAVQALRSLDPYFPAYAAAHYRHAEKVRAVADPVHPRAGDPDDAPPWREAVPPERIVFLLFGVLGRRKGILALLEALRRLEPRCASAIAVCIAGQIDRAVAGRVHEALAEIADLRPELWLQVEDRRLSTAELAAAIARADVILAPYQRFVGSSGVLLWAAKSGKPVITQDYGLLGRLVDDFRLGMAVDATDPSEIAAAIAATVRRGPGALADAAGMQRFLDGHSGERFAAGVLDGIQPAVAAHPISPAEFEERAATD